MNSVTLNQLAGVLRAVLPIILTLVAAWGFMPAESVEPATDAVVALVSAIAGITTVFMAIWSWYSNRAPAVAKQAASVEGVTVVVDKTAPTEVKAVAADPTEPSVYPKP